MFVRSGVAVAGIGLQSGFLIISLKLFLAACVALLLVLFAPGYKLFMFTDSLNSGAAEKITGDTGFYEFSRRGRNERQAEVAVWNGSGSVEYRTAVFKDNDARLSKTLASPVYYGPHITWIDKLAVYIWDSHEVLDKLQYTTLFWSHALSALKVKTVLLALDPQQLKEATSSPAKVEYFLNQAHARGIRVELLLGDSVWAMDKYRDDMVGVIQDMSQFQFDAVHIDVEPVTIWDLPLDKAKFDSWMRTYKAAADAAPWPVNVDMHHRYFWEDPYVSWGIGQRLLDAGIEHVTIMYYNSNPVTVSAVLKPIMKGYPKINFSVAQSVEHHLPANLSHFTKNPDQMNELFAELNGYFKDEPNYSGIVLQEWKDLLGMDYDETVYYGM